MAEIVLFPIMELNTSKYGKVDFGEEFAANVLAHFEQRVLKIDPAVDVGHEGGKAMGWIKKLFRASFKNAAGKEIPAVKAEVEWTPEGAEAIKDKHFRYFSPEIGSYKDEETGKTYYPVLFGGALTNTPVLKLMPEVSLSDCGKIVLSEKAGCPPIEIELEDIPATDFEEAPTSGALLHPLLDEFDSLLSRGEEFWKGITGAPTLRTYLKEVRARLAAMNLRKLENDDIAAADGVTKTEDGLAFPAAAYAYVPDPEKSSTWKLRLWETPEKKETPKQVGAAIAALSPGGFRGQRVDIPAGELAAVKAKVRAAWKKVNPDKDPSEMPRHMMDEKRRMNMSEIHKLLQLSEEATDEEVEKKLSEILGQNKELADKVAAAEKAGAEDKKELGELTKRLTDTESKMVFAEGLALIEAACSEGRMLPAQRELWGKRFMADPEGTRELIGSLGKVIDLGEHGSGQSPQGSPENLFMAEIKKVMKEEKLGFTEAMNKVQSENPELAKQYQKAVMS